MTRGPNVARGSFLFGPHSQKSVLLLCLFDWKIFEQPKLFSARHDIWVAHPCLIGWKGIRFKFEIKYLFQNWVRTAESKNDEFLEIIFLNLSLIHLN